jgi:hypothetical protein
MFNREYHIRSARRAIIAEIARGYYRPASRPDPRNGDRPRARLRTVDNSQVIAQLKLPFALTEQELAEDFESTFQ